MTPNQLTKAICEYGLKPYITFEIVRNHYECSLKPEYQNRIKWKYNSNVDHILTIAFTCKHQTVKRRLLHLKRMIDQELLKRYRILDLKGLASKEATVRLLLEHLDENDEALTFTEDDNRYQLRSRRGVITYERNGYTMMTFAKEGDRFKMSLRDSHLLNEHVYFNVENLVAELIDKL